MTDREHHQSRRLFLTAMASLVSTAAVRADPAIELQVSKDPNCGCCEGWIAHMRENGFAVTVRNTADINAVKRTLRVPPALASCHTAEIGGYVVEGHVPASAVRRLLGERPHAIGLSAPGMPIGSPGMEGGQPETYDIVLFGEDAQRVFMRFRGQQPI